MPLNIKNPEADALARQLASLTGESITDAVIRAMAERLERVRARSRRARLRQEMDRIQGRYQRLRLRDKRSAEEIIGYDAAGLPGS
jgi:antitoxin VapB